MKFDFSGYATRNDLKCSDGRTIRKDAFKDCDGMTVPLVWNHRHDDPSNVLGHALLENREDGVYAYGVFNDTMSGRDAKEMVKNGDVKALSIYANKLKQNGGDVLHGAIREVSLVLAGANPGAFIDVVLAHGDGIDGEAILCYDEGLDELSHSEEEPKNKNVEEKPMDEKNKIKEDPELEEDSGETVGDVFNTLTEKQKKVVYAMIGMAIEDKKSNENGDDDMKHNVFDNDLRDEENVLTHSDMEDIISDAKRYGSMKESVLQHGIADITYEDERHGYELGGMPGLFPEAHNPNNVPGFYNKYAGAWVNAVINGVKRSPFARLKSVWADISDDDARALGFIPDRTHRDAKGNLVDGDGNRVMKKEEVFGLLKRTTSPCTIYKKQRLDRDDIVDITDFDVVAWIKGEMRAKLDEEIARAILIGDQRSSSSDDKINEQNIRPIWTDSNLFTMQNTIEVATTATAADKAEALIDKAVKARIGYKGTGEPTLFISESLLAECLLLKDLNGHRIYKTEQELATAMRVKNIVTVPYFENLTRNVNGVTHTLGAIIVNLSDYSVGADKGGAVNMFDDFDIDYNAQKYLIETRISGSLMNPKSAIAIDFVPEE